MRARGWITKEILQHKECSHTAAKEAAPIFGLYPKVKRNAAVAYNYCFVKKRSPK